MCLSPAELLARFAKQTAGEVFAGGDGVQQYFPQFAAAGSIEVPDPDDRLHQIQARHHLLPGNELAGYSFADLVSITPVYVRAPDADKTVLLRKKEPWLE